MSTATKWWHKEADQIVCDLCPRECHLHEGQRGFCFVRQNVGGQMELVTYGRSSGYCIDPIEKKPLNHFLPGTPVLSFGTAGCNLGCKFCQNWSISKARETDTLSDEASPEAIADAAARLGCRSVAFTYNDPVIFAEYAIDTANACHDRGIKTVAVTAGYITPLARPEFYAVMDAANVDLKAFTEVFYRHMTLSHLEPVLDTLRWLKRESNVWFEITNLIIPQENDTDDEIARMCDWIVKNLGVDVPIHFTAYHPDFRVTRPPTPPETLIRAREMALRAGIEFAYVGNVNDVVRQSTYCPRCGELLIERDWYDLGRYQLNGNRCSRCGTTIPGVFEDRPGDWGRKRMPVRLKNDLTPVLTNITLPRNSHPTPEKVDVRKLGDGARVDFSEADCQSIVRYVRRVIEAAVLRQPAPALEAPLGQAPTFGAFVTLHRGDMLRGCRGRWGTIRPLVEVVGTAARETALLDPRFPAIKPEELTYLDVEVSLMHSPRVIEARGAAERIREIEVGRHGLFLAHPRGRGLLLPQVAVEGGWNAEQFLDRVSSKAGLDSQAWRDAQAELMTFEARILHEPPACGEFDVGALTPGDFAFLADLADAAFQGRDPGELTAPEALRTAAPTTIGVVARSASGMLALSVGEGKSPASLAVAAGRFLAERIAAGDRKTEPIRRLFLLSRPIPIRPEDYPDRCRTLAGRAFLLRAGQRWTFAVSDLHRQNDVIPELFAAMKLSADDWKSSADIRLTSFAVKGWNVERKNAGGFLRPPAMAGSFYPADVREMREEIDRYLAGDAERSQARCAAAVMLPHAGWLYCGPVAGAVLRELVVPDRVIVIGPKHTALGPRWSVSAAAAWEIPGAQIPVDVELRSRLLEGLQEAGLECENEAHQSEHAVEVILPFLFRRNPRISIVPIVLGSTNPGEISLIADQLASLIRDDKDPPLLVISSDMNHFAREAENRRLDMMAVEALQSGDPAHVFATIRNHRISMCGVIPAVVVLTALKEFGPVRGRLVEYRNSAWITNDVNRVVGYAGMTFGEVSL